MAMHVPFSERPSGRRLQQPVYIGFERPRRRCKPRNWWGFSSLFVFFLSFGVLSPVTLLMGLKGLTKKPRSSAMFGTILSLIGTGVMASIVGLAVHEAKEHEFRHERRMQQRALAAQCAECNDLLAFAAEEFEGFRDDNDGALPTGLDGNALAIKHLDPWGTELMFETRIDSAALRSAGPDGEYFTNDDLAYDIDGKTDIQPLLPVDEDTDSEKGTDADDQEMD